MGFLRCCVYYGILAVVSFFIGRLLPKSWFHGDKFPYRCANWEAKLFRFLRVHEWQDKVPDMSKIVAIHGGEVWVEDPVNGGCRFAVCLPTEK